MKPFVRSSNRVARRYGDSLFPAVAGSRIAVAFPSCIRRSRGRPLPETFNGVTSEDNSASIPIDAFFNDPVLTNLIHQALAGNQQLRILGQDIQIANYEIISRRCVSAVHLLGAGAINTTTARSPGATIRDDPFRPAPASPNPLPDFMVAADVSWQIDIWRQLRNARDAAGLRYLATIDGRTYAVTRLVADIAENYYTLMSLDKRLENLDRTIALQEQSLQIAIARKEVARGTELGFSVSRPKFAKTRAKRYIIHQQIIETENRINFLFGRFPQPVERNSARILQS